jgi:catechol 2,3-dioxygenase-like lactoylglutathione lyase family enzyme
MFANFSEAAIQISIAIGRRIAINGALKSSDTIRFSHTNLIAKDWQRLAAFYADLFQCEPVSSERDHHGPKFEALTARPQARARGRHLRLPGHGENGPTLEIFEYTGGLPLLKPEIARPGFAHIAFEVPNVAEKRLAIIAAGGRDCLTLCYMCDPEGNIIELQTWQRETAPSL